MAKRPGTRPRRPLSDLQKEGAKGLNIDKITDGIPRRKDGSYTPQNQKKRHDAVAAWFLAKDDGDKARLIEAALPPARPCSWCGDEKRDFRTMKLKGERYILCKECEDGALVTGDPLGMPKHKPTPEMLDDGEAPDITGSDEKEEDL